MAATLAAEETDAEERCVFAHRSPHALQRLFTPVGPARHLRKRESATMAEGRRENVLGGIGPAAVRTTATSIRRSPRAGRVVLPTATECELPEIASPLALKREEVLLLIPKLLVDIVHCEIRSVCKDDRARGKGTDVGGARTANSCTSSYRARQRRCR